MWGGRSDCLGESLCVIRQCLNWPGSLSESVMVVEVYCYLFKVWGVPGTLSVRQDELRVSLSVDLMFGMCY